MYSGSESELIDDDVFETVIPFTLFKYEISDNEELSDKGYREIILSFLDENGEINATDALKLIGRNLKTIRRVLLKLVSGGYCNCKWSK